MFNIKIKISPCMTNRAGVDTNENKMLRIPKTLCSILGVEVGRYLGIKSANGTQTMLEIGPAYKEDADVDEKLCYVTETVFNTINIEGTKDYRLEPVNTITLGCDPEFFLLDKFNRKMLRAYLFFNKKYGEVGSDGILAEIRPKPSITPEGLTDNIYNLICNTREILNRTTLYDPSRIMMYAASGYQSATAGFHLHFGLPKGILGKTPNNEAIMKQIVRVMDYYVGMPSIMIEGENDNSRRTDMSVRYGKPSDFRLDDRTLEYRVAGGHMLRHPLLTEGLIAIGATVMQDIVSRVKLSTNGFKQLYWAQSDERFKELYPDILNSKDTYRLMCCPNVIESRRYLNNIHNGIQNMIGYEGRRASIEALFSSIENNVQYDNNIESNWRTFYGRPSQLYQTTSAKTFNCSGS